MCSPANLCLVSCSLPVFVAVNVNLFLSVHQRTLLHQVMYYNDGREAHRANFLLDHGADPNIKDNGGVSERTRSDSDLM